MRFTDRTLKALHPKAKPYTVREEGSHGFMLKVSPTKGGHRTAGKKGRIVVRLLRCHLVALASARGYLASERVAQMKSAPI